MSDHFYDIAISFAGAQRTEAQAIAAQLRKKDISVFFDEYEAATLWGTDLNEHLMDVYQHQARYCLMLISSAYAERVWTTVERRSAQARAIRQKGIYILPVRFDNTTLPGFNDNIAYVTFQEYGIDGIANLVIAKINGGPIGVVKKSQSPAPYTCSSSPLAYLHNTDQQVTAWLPVQAAKWMDDTITLTVTPQDHADTAFLQELTDRRTTILLAHGHNAAITHLREHHVNTIDNQDAWTLTLHRSDRELSSSMEMNFQDCSADEVAQRRVERLLLNKHLPSQTRDLNKTMIEHAISGNSNAPLLITASPFPGIYAQLRDDQERFLYAAWITAVAMLRLTGTIATITKLDLTLDATTLAVDFIGRRAKQYSNRPPTTINVKGTIALLTKM